MESSLLVLRLIIGLGTVQPEQRIRNLNCIDIPDEAGQCDRGCKVGFYGLYCNKTCSENCDNACSQDTGHCLTGCDIRWYMFNCTRQCIGYCKDDVCDIVSGECIYGCESGYYGTKCDKNCSSSCLDSACDEFGGCVCQKGVKDKSCYIDCSDNCLDGQCAMTDDGQLQCLKGCTAERTGPFCQEWCHRNKSDGVCFHKNMDRRRRRRGSGHCEREADGKCLCCTDGWTGDQCKIECPKCIYSYRNKTCRSSCEGGYFGDECHLHCSNTCSRGTNGRNVCEKESGHCHSGCLQGYHGFTCTDKCSLSCKGRRCFPTNGSCAACEPGKYGPECQDACGHCKDRECGRNGTCDCEQGWYGLRCKDKCSDNCKTDDCRVDRKGYHVCVGECVDGYTGGNCLSKCPGGCEKCDRKNGTCLKKPDSKSDAIAIGIGIGIAIGVSISVAIFIILRKRGKCRNISHCGYRKRRPHSTPQQASDGYELEKLDHEPTRVHVETTDDNGSGETDTQEDPATTGEAAALNTERYQSLH